MIDNELISGYDCQTFAYKPETDIEDSTVSV